MFAPSSRLAVLKAAWPIILANASVPLLGLSDTAVMGHTGSVADLGALALGVLIFNFIYWSFGFLRMSTTGFVAQAAGAGDGAEVRASLLRALLLAAALGWLLIAGQSLLRFSAFHLLQGSEAVSVLARDYFAVRIWGAPATLALFVLSGYLIGMGKNRWLLLLQLGLNGLNIALDILFAGMLGLGVAGIALGTVVAEWSLCILSLSLLWLSLKKQLPKGHRLWDPARLWAPAKIRAMLSSNRDIMVRTLALLGAFAWFVNQGAGFGDTVLAANHLLLALVSFSAFFLDGFAFVAESRVGRAVGAKDRIQFQRAVRHTSELAGITAALLAVTIWIFGSQIIPWLSDLPAVNQQAQALLPWISLYILLSVAAFQLDGIFIGAAATAAMRNASLLSLLVFLACSLPLVHWGGVQGLWASFVIYVCARAGTLLLYLGRLRSLF